MLAGSRTLVHKRTFETKLRSRGTSSSRALKRVLEGLWYSLEQVLYSLNMNIARQKREVAGNDVA